MQYCKQIKLDLYQPDFNNLKHFEDLKSNINWIVMQIVGEIAFRKHIKQIQLNQLPLDDSGLLSMIDLPDFIDYLYIINYSVKKINLVSSINSKTIINLFDS